MSVSLTPAQKRALKALGLTQAQYAAAIKPASARQSVAPAAKPNTFYRDVIAKRVPCAYGVAACGTFAPNGVGSKQHTTCKKGLAALRKARA